MASLAGDFFVFCSGRNEWNIQAFLADHGILLIISNKIC